MEILDKIINARKELKVIFKIRNEERLALVCEIARLEADLLNVSEEYTGLSNGVDIFKHEFNGVNKELDAILFDMYKKKFNLEIQIDIKNLELKNIKAEVEQLNERHYAMNRLIHHLRRLNEQKAAGDEIQ